MFEYINYRNGHTDNTLTMLQNIQKNPDQDLTQVPIQYFHKFTKIYKRMEHSGIS